MKPTGQESAHLEAYGRFVVEFFEIIGLRASGDLRPMVFPLSEGKKRIADYLGAPHPLSAEVGLLSRLISTPLSEVAKTPNVRLKRVRVMRSISRIRHQDSACLRWLARQPGRTVVEKAGAKQKLLAVDRVMDADILENRVVNLLVDRLRQRVTREDDQNGVDFSGNDDFRYLCDSLRMWEGESAKRGMRHLTYMPSPNNVLRRDRRYRRLWIGLQRLVSEGNRLDVVKNSLDNLLCYVAGQCLGLALGELGWMFIETAWVVEDSPRYVYHPPDKQGVWIALASDSISRVTLAVLDSHVEASFVQLGCSGFKESRYRFLGRFTDDGRYVVCLEPDASKNMTGNLVEQEVVIGPGLEYLRTSVEGFVKLLSCYPEFRQPIDLPELVPPVIELNNGSCAVLRFTYDQVKCFQGGKALDWPLYAGALHVDRATSHAVSFDNLGVYGDQACKLVAFQAFSALPISGAQVGRARFAPRHWMIPGKTQSVSDDAENPSFRNFVDLLVRACCAVCIPANTTLAVAWPGRFGLAAPRKVRQRLCAHAATVWLVPQTVAAALAWATQKKTVAPLAGFYLFVDLESDVVDAGVLELKPSVNDSSMMEWLRWREERVSEPPGMSNLITRVLRLALERSSLPMPSRREMLSLHSQLDVKAIMSLVANPDGEIVVWLKPVCEGTRRVPVSGADVSTAVKEYRENFLTYIEKVIAQLICRPLKIIVSGRLAAAAVFGGDQCVDGVPVEFMGGDAVPDGLVRFVDLHSRGLPSWRDYIPSLKLLVRGEGKPTWFNLFDDVPSPAPGDKVKGKSFKFTVPRGMKRFVLPLQKDDIRASVDPVIELDEPLSTDSKVDIWATYETAQDGLRISYQSSSDGPIPLTEASWGRIAQDRTHDPQAYEQQFRLVSDGRIRDVSAGLDKAFEEFCAGRCSTSKVIENEVKNIGKFLKDSVSQSDVMPWESILAGGVSDLARMTSILSYLYCGDVNACSLVIRDQKNAKGIRPPHGGIVSKAKKGMESSSGLGLELIRTLGLLRAACPEVVLAKWDGELNSGKLTRLDSAVTERILHAAGRVAGKWLDGGGNQRLIKTLFENLTRVAESGGESQVARPLMWAIGSFLRGQEDASKGMPTELLLKGARSVLVVLRRLSLDKAVDNGVWSDGLYAFVSFRHCTRNEDGMESFGPSSPFVRELTATVNNMRVSLRESGLFMELAKVHAGRLGIRETSPFHSGDGDILGQVTELWQGRVTALLVQEGVSVKQ